MSDLVKRLRGMETYGYQSQLACEAADRIEVLEAALARIADAEYIPNIRAFARSVLKSS